MISRPWRRLRPIGVELEGRFMHAVQSDGVRVTAAAKAPRDNPEGDLTEADARRLDGALKRGGFTVSELVLAVPPQQQLVAMLELPPRSSGAPVDQIAQAELARAHRCDPESLAAASWDLPAPARSSAATHVMATACAHEHAEHLVAMFEPLGLRLVGLDLQAWALARACGLSGAQAANGQTSAVLALDWREARVALVHNGVLVYEHALPLLGLAPLHRQLCESMRLQPQMVDHLLRDVGFSDRTAHSDFRGSLSLYFDPLIDSLRNAFAYASHRYPDSPLGCLYLAGEGAAIPGLSGRLTEAAAQVHVARPSELARAPATLLRALEDPAYITALGLSQYPTEALA